ncbi:MAG: hypothetical protein RBR42_05135 [Desulfomicrobium sp.]|nr:hypothetical protein [Desulfomicrobium sp.]
MRSMVIFAMFVVLILAQPSWAFRMFGPGGQYMNSSAPKPPPPVIKETPSRYKAKLHVQKLYEEHNEEQERVRAEEMSVDLAGVTWSQGRGVYSGRRNMRYSEKLGFRAGLYALEYRYKGDRFFGLWMHSRRNGRESQELRVGGIKRRVEMQLPYDDEIWFEVQTSWGNWEITFERVGD